MKIEIPKFTRWDFPLLKHLSTHYCLLCEEALTNTAGTLPEALCVHCKRHLIRARHSCQACGIEIACDIDQVCNTERLSIEIKCGQCLKKSPHFDHTFSPYIYQKPLSKLIKQFKHHKQLTIGHQLGTLFAKEVHHHYEQNHLSYPDWIVPVPLHWRRLWQRGFNQSLILGEIIAKQLNIPLLRHLKKQHNSLSQEKLDRKQRLKNLRHAFKITKPLSGSHCAIIDDVMTTGTTVNNLALELKKAGATRVDVWALSRTPK